MGRLKKIQAHKPPKSRAPQQNGEQCGGVIRLVTTAQAAESEDESVGVLTQ